MKRSHLLSLRILIPCCGLAMFVSSCQKTEAPPAPAVTQIPVTEAKLVGSDATWGNTEGPQVDSKGTVYFTSRGTFKGIASWNEKDGPKQYMAVAVKEGPGGLFIDAGDNIYVTATGERQILKISPDKKVTVVAQKFEAKPEVAKGPNDLVVAADGTIYFTDPNGYDGSAPNGTVYRVDPAGKTSVFNDTITGPNGIALSADEKTLYVSHNVDKQTAKIEKWPLVNGAAGAMTELATVPNCMADGIKFDQSGAVWITCYSYGTAHRISAGGKIVETVTTEQKALTNCVFGRGANNRTLYLTSSNMERVTGYVYAATVSSPGVR